MASKDFKQSILLVCLTILSLAACSGGSEGQPPPVVLSPVSKAITLDHFGYAAVACGHDDPHDSEVKADYSDEVAAFTNANQVCVTGDMAVLEQRLRDTAAFYMPVFYVEPVFFAFDASGGDLNPDADTLWTMARSAISASGVSPDDMIFYLVDEPTLRNLPLSDVTSAADMIRRDYPNARIMMIEAYHGPDAPIIPTGIDIWGFDAYTIPDPAADARYTGYLDLASARLASDQSLAIIMDGNFTPHHAAAGLTEADMAQVARNYLALAKARNDVSIMLAYTWAGGIDGPDEKGVRDMPQLVIEAHMAIGREITGKP